MRIDLKGHKKYRVVIESTGQEIVQCCLLADSFFRRLKGLMFRSSLDSNEGLLIVPCNSIHTFFMNFPIDLIFIDRSGNAIFEKRCVNPGKTLKTVHGAWATLELTGGKLESLGFPGTIKGEKIIFEAL